MAARGQLDRALAYASQIDIVEERAMACALLLPAFVKANRVAEVQALAARTDGIGPGFDLLKAAFALLSGPAADEQGLAAMKDLHHAMRERLALVQMGLGDLQGAAKTLGNLYFVWTLSHGHGRHPIHPTMKRFLEVGPIEDFVRAASAQTQADGFGIRPLYQARWLAAGPLGHRAAPRRG